MPRAISKRTARKATVKFAYKLHNVQQEIWDAAMGKSLNRNGQAFRFLVAVLGRQTGKSMLGKIILLHMAINLALRCLWVSPTIGTARKHWIDMKKMLLDAGITVESGYITSINEAAKEIVFYNGGIINIRSAIEPDNMRGLTIDFMVLDEAAFFREGEYVWNSVLFPMLTVSRGKALILTSPFGRNWIYDLFRRGQDPEDKYYKSWNASVFCNPHQDFDLLEEQREKMPSMQWRAEFMAEFLADAGGVFTGVEKAAKVEPYLRPIPGRRYIMGIDLGFSKDFTCVTIIDITDEVAYQVFGTRWTLSGTIEAGKKIRDLIELWQPEHAYFEKNGVGDTIMRLLREMIRYGDDFEYEAYDLDYDLGAALPQGDQLMGDTSMRYNEHVKIHALSLANNSKRTLVETCAAAIEWGRLEVLEPGAAQSYGDVQIGEMSIYERQLTNSGMGVTYNAASGGHDDTVSALYLACRGLPKVHAHRKARGERPTGKITQNKKFSFRALRDSRRALAKNRR